MKRLKTILLGSITIGLILTGCGGGSSSSSDYTLPKKTYSLKGIAYDGPLYNSKVTAFTKDSKEIATVLIENEDGTFSFEDLKQKPAFIKVQDGIDLGLDGKLGGGDDTFFADTLYSTVKDENITVTPLTTLEFIAKKDLGLGDSYKGDDLKDIIAVTNIIKLLKAKGLNSKEAYEIVAQSINPKDETRTFENDFTIDTQKLEKNLEEKGISSKIVKDVTDALHQRLSNLPENLEPQNLNKDLKADIYSMQTAVSVIKDTIETQKQEGEEENLDDLSILMDPVSLDSIKEAIIKTGAKTDKNKEEIDLGEFAKTLSNTAQQDQENLKNILYSNEMYVPVTCSSKSSSIRSFEKSRSGSVVVTCGPKQETFKACLDCDNDGILLKSICSTTGGICKICQSGMIKEIKLQRRYIRVTESGNPTVDQKFDAVKDYLKDLFTFEFKSSGSSLSVSSGEKKNFIATIVIKRLNKCSGTQGGYITASFLVNVTKNANDYIFKVPANSKLFITSNTGQMGQLVITKTISSEKSLTCANGDMVIKVGDYLDQIVSVAGNSSYAQDAKKMIYEYTTQAGTFEIYFMLNESTKDGGTGVNNKDFIKNPYIFDATKYQLDLNPYNQTFCKCEHAFKATVCLN